MSETRSGSPLRSKAHLSEPPAPPPARGRRRAPPPAPPLSSPRLARAGPLAGTVSSSALPGPSFLLGSAGDKSLRRRFRRAPRGRCCRHVGIGRRGGSRCCSGSKEGLTCGSATRSVFLLCRCEMDVLSPTCGFLPYQTSFLRYRYPPEIF